MPHLHPIIFPLVPCRFKGGTKARSGWRMEVPHPGQDGVAWPGQDELPPFQGQDRDGVPPG